MKNILINGINGTIIKEAKRFYSLESANLMCEKYQSGDPDWTYKVTELEQSQYVIEVYDEDDAFVGYVNECY